VILRITSRTSVETRWSEQPTKGGGPETKPTQVVEPSPETERASGDDLQPRHTSDMARSESSAPTQAHPVVSTNRDSHPLVGHSENPATLGNFRGLCCALQITGRLRMLEQADDKIPLNRHLIRCGSPARTSKGPVEIRADQAPRLDAAIHELDSTASEPRAGGRNRLRRPAEQCRSERSFALTIPLAGIRHDQHNEWHESSFSKLSALETLAP
jgi:hypothetical protein